MRQLLAGLSKLSILNLQFEILWTQYCCVDNMDTLPSDSKTMDSLTY